MEHHGRLGVPRGGEAATLDRPDEPHQRYARRLSDKILIAFHHACDQQEIDIAVALLDTLEFMTKRPPNLPTGSDRRAKDSLIAAHERLWQLRHPALGD
jgi:hypothetical protein